MVTTLVIFFEESMPILEGVRRGFVTPLLMG